MFSSSVKGREPVLRMNGRHQQPKVNRENSQFDRAFIFPV